MDPQRLKDLLENVRAGTLSADDALEQLKALPFEDLGFAKVDHHRALRRGFPEAIFGAGKTPEQIDAIVGRIAGRGQRVLVTRTSADVHARLAHNRPEAVWHEAARCITVESGPRVPLPGSVAVLA